ncbi:hypothetical protein [Pontiella agarivorans]|uniref:NYN domain-containing protein n=1 Tax=Pontiella agarivorans TaxID=3038953 RepID=A0ABU5N076_9BACT|nr:hypothetical protein [Pontiella agarivorans]MDZ8119855.1 hypothetical protein [Pontiella agarivorans]
MGLFNLFKPARTVLVVDVVSLNEATGQKGKIPPRNQLQMLRRLARFAQREKLEVIAVLCGTPLNKAPAGKNFEGIAVAYSASMDEHAKCLVKTAQSKGAGAVMISGNAAAEKLVGSQVKKMRVSTFRKAFDTGGDDGGNERSEGGNNNRSRGNRPPRRRQKKNGGGENNNNGNNNNKPKAERKPKDNMSESDAINELIDLVD